MAAKTKANYMGLASFGVGPDQVGQERRGKRFRERRDALCLPMAGLVGDQEVIFGEITRDQAPLTAGREGTMDQKHRCITCTIQFGERQGRCSRHIGTIVSVAEGGVGSAGRRPCRKLPCSEAAVPNGRVGGWL